MQPAPQNNDFLVLTIADVSRHPEVLAVAGEIDIVTVEPLREAVTALIGRTPPGGAAVLDLSAVTFFGSDGIELLMLAHDGLRR